MRQFYKNSDTNNMLYQFQAKLPAREFRKYKCVGRVRLEDKQRRSLDTQVWENEKAVAETEATLG